MPVVELGAAIAAFVVVAGYTAVAWLRRGREPVFVDDPSILVPAPPPGMTAATATIIDGGPAHLAFMAALLDLASRDEIAFEAEARAGNRALVGIAIHGGESADPAVRLNRRLPIGEGETWLLTQLKMSLLEGERHVQVDGVDRSMPSPEMLQVGSRMMAAMMSAAFGLADDDPATRAAHEHGLLHGGARLDPDAMAAAYEARTGKPMAQRSVDALHQMATTMQAFSDPMAIAQNPDSLVQMIESRSGRPMTPDEQGQLKQWAAAYAAQAAPSGAAKPEYIPAQQALRLRAPLLFGTFLQTYATRHGWLAGLPLLKRLRWRFIALAEIAIGVAMAWLGTGLGVELLTGAGAGAFVGGLLTWFVAPAMVAKTREGAEMKAQLAAYRRTLQMTFGQARSMDAAVAATGMTWLETPDQALVWGIALGLRADIEALLARTAADLRQGQGAAAGYAPAWFSAGGAPVPAPGPVATAVTAGVPPPAGVQALAGFQGPAGAALGFQAPAVAAASPGVPASLADAPAMFAGIEAIGSETSQPTRRS